MENKLKIKSISINNFKSIWNSEEIDISGGIIPILGMNGAGKSNILKAIDWFSNDDGYEESIKNFYRIGNEINQTYVSFNIGINLTQKENSAFNDSNKLIIKTFLESMIVETIDKISLISPLNTIEVSKEYNNFIEETLAKSVVRVFKIRKEIESKRYLDLYTINKFPIFGIERNSSDYLKLIQIVSEYINKFLINIHFPQIKFYKTSQTLNDFSDEKITDSNSELVNNGISFDALFRGIPLKNDTMPNYKLIDNMIKSMNHEEIDSLDTFSILASKEYTSSGNMHDEGEYKITLRKFQELFSQWINENAFFKSINTNMTFMIYPEIMHGTEVKLTMFDVVKIDGEEPRKHLLDNIRKKNDGFIFALLLFFDIEFSHSDETIILIDEPANFLSTNSIRLLMETFRRSKKQRDIKFVFTTHSSNTLDKNIVKIEDVLIARKGKDHSTIINKAVKITPDSPEWEIIYDEYKIPRKGIDIIKESQNYLVSAEKAFEKDFYRIIDTLNIGNIIPLVDIKILRNNLKIISKMNNEFSPGKLSEKFSGKLNVSELFDEYEISELAYDLRIMGGEASAIRMKKEEEYKVLWLTRILRHFENDIKGLIKSMPKSMNKIKEVFTNE